VDACQAAERVVQSRMYAPSTADWVGNCWRADGRGGSGYQVVSTGSGQHRWVIEVDAQNRFGAQLRTRCIVDTDTGTGRATLVACE
jgi:hypothetical protein